MPNDRFPVQIIEVDYDFCSRVFGDYNVTTNPTGCQAVLSTAVVRKCYNTYSTCSFKSAFNNSPLTLRFIDNVENSPKTTTYFPVLVKVSESSSSVNIAGSDDELGPLGRRAIVNVSLKDFPYDDQLTDKYRLQRISGTAQTDEGGYNPLDRQTFFTKLRARWPYYTGRPMRIISGYLVNGVLVDTQTRAYIITDFKINDNNDITISGKDILALADDKKALVPAPSRGRLKVAMDNSSIGLVRTLDPSGVGTEYPASGYAVIGSEVMAFTRSGDDLTFTTRADKKTIASSHSINDTVQVAFVADNVRIDDLIYDWLVTYAKVPASFLDNTNWATEIDTWLPFLNLSGVITKPVGVATIVGEMSLLGVSIWWDAIAQKIKLKANRPVYTDTVIDLTDNEDIISISKEDQDEKRLTQVHFYTAQADPTKGDKTKSNFDTVVVSVDVDAESINAHNDTRVKEVFSRWLTGGGENIAALLSLRLLKRFNTAPARYRIMLDNKDKAIGLTDVIRVTSRIISNDAGKSAPTLLQVVKRVETKEGHQFELTAQAYDFFGKYGSITPNSQVPYASATAQDKIDYCFLSDGALFFADGAAPYEFV